MIFFLFSCGKKADNIFSYKDKTDNVKIYEGDLAIKSIDLGTTYVRKDSLGNITHNLLDTLRQKEELDKGEKFVLQYFEHLEKHNLVDAPIIKVNFDSTLKSMTSVFLPKKNLKKSKNLPRKY